MLQNGRHGKVCGAIAYLHAVKDYTVICFTGREAMGSSIRGGCDSL
jgi:hypothetical protein